MAAKFAWYLLSFTGRVTRGEFWLGYLGFIAVSFLLLRSLTDLSMFALRPKAGPWYRDELDFALALPKMLVATMLLWPLIAIAAKRLHDLNRSGWWLLVLPAISAAARLSGLDRWSVTFWIALVVLGAIPGTRGDNRFGADPLAAPPR